MVAKYEFGNSRYLYVEELKGVIPFLKNSKIGFPKCIFEVNDAHFSDKEIKDLVHTLIVKGCRLLTFYGIEAEHYHEIADRYLECLEHGTDLITTYHDDEPNDEIANFVINGMSTVNSQKILLIVADCKNNTMKNEIMRL
jgi:hypothetical protein